jgi:hypothetical protein
VGAFNPSLKNLCLSIRAKAQKALGLKEKGNPMKSLSRMVSGKVAAPLVMLFALAFAFFAFTLPSESESAPSVGLAETNDTMIVADVLAELPGQDGTAAIVVYRTADGSAMTDAQQEWILGEKKVITPFPGAPEIVTYEVTGEEILGDRPKQSGSDLGTADLEGPK